LLLWKLELAVMELRQLEYFVAVAEEANFTRAAERVHISQSGVSAQIRQLERELGAELLDRSTRTATLTIAGQAALEHARAALASARAVQLSVGEVTGLIRGRLVVGMVIGCSIIPLFDALATFHDERPGVELALLEGNSDRLVDDVRSGAIDLALIGIAATTPHGLQALTIVSERVVAVVPPGHPLTRRRRVTLSHIDAYPIVCMPPGTGIRTVFDLGCAAKGITPTIALQASAADAIVDLVDRGLGVGILSESMAARYHDRVTTLVINDVTTPVLLALIWNPTPNAALREMIQHSRTAFAKPQPDPKGTRVVTGVAR
jgi:DNA-binding transcriptional LysR family regulator